MQDVNTVVDLCGSACIWGSGIRFPRPLRGQLVSLRGPLNLDVKTLDVVL